MKPMRADSTPAFRIGPSVRCWRLAQRILNRCVALPATLFLATLAQAQDARYTYDLSGNVVVRTSGGIIAPQILGQPQLQIVAPGELASFSVIAANSRGLGYQWRFNGGDLPGQTRDALLLSNAGTNNEGPYSVVLANSAGSVTSSIAPLYIDSDGDGLPDSWELVYFGSLGSQRGGGDADGDGVSNLQEFLDGTNPTNAASRNLRLVLMSDGGGVAVAAPSQVNYTNGASVILNATPFPSNSFYSWTGDLISRSNPATLTLNSNKSVSAHFLCDPPPAGIVGWWRAENDAQDALGANPGSLSNGLSFAAGQVGQAFRFNAASQEVRIAASPVLNLGAGNGLTVEAWIKPADLVTQFPLVEWNDGTTIGAHLWLNVAFSGQGGPGCFYANLRDLNSADHFFFTPINLLSTSVWQHVALTYDRTSGIAQLFLNGFAVSSANLGSFVPRTTADLHLGFRPGYISYQGLLDEPAFYNRALTPNEILGIYLADAAGKCTTTPIFISPAQFPDAVAGVGYTQQVTTVRGTLPVALSLSAGTLPAGLALSPSGLLAGIPAAPGSNVFAVLATEVTGRSAEQVCSLRVFPAPAPAMVPGLVAWWRAENNSLDSAGTNHGFLTNGASFAAGEVGQAFALNGITNYVQVGDKPSLNFSNSFSFEAWIFPTGYGSDPTTGGIILGKEGQYEASRFADGTIRWAFANSSPGYTWASSGFVAPLNQWSHLVVTYADGIVTTFGNGVLVQTYAGSGTVGFAQLGQNDFRIGGRQAVGQYFQGRIDEISMYNRVLSAGEAALLYGAGAAGKVTAGPYINTAGVLPDAVIGQTYSQTITAIRGSTPINFAVAAGALPPGLNLASGGLLSGTPTNAGNFNFTIRATDAGALTTDQLFTLQVFAPMPPPGGLVSWWRAETNALDSVGTNHGILRNGAGFAPGKIGQAFFFDGIDDAVEILDSPTLRPASLTLETWILLNGGGGYRVLFAKPLGAGTLDSYTLLLNNGTLLGAVADASGFGPTLTAGFSLVPGTWHHLAYTFDDGTKQQAMFIDGLQVAGGVVNKSIAYDSQSLFFGRDTDNGDAAFYFSGRVDESALYNRALAGTEIASLYNAGPAGKTTAGPYFTTPPSLPDAIAGVGYTQVLATVRGTAPITFALAGGTLPAGLNLSSGGVLSGVPAVAGSLNFTIRATDLGSRAANQLFTLQVLPKVSPPAGIVGWWRAENDALDAIGASDGVPVNGATFAPGKVGQAFSLDGLDDVIEVADTPALRPASLTLETWVLFFSAGGIQAIMSKTLGGGTSDSFALWYENGNLRGLISDSGGGNSFISAPFTPELGRWYHVAFTFDNSSKDQWLYLNGQAVATGASNRTIGYDEHSVLIGGDNDNGSLALLLQGRVDEPAIYNRALGSGEIAALYAGGTGGKSSSGPYFSTPPQLPVATLGRAYTQALSSVRGAVPFTYSLAGGALPAGLVLSSAGVLMGIPTAAGSFNFIVRVTDAAGLSGAQSFALEIFQQVPPPAGLVAWWRAENNGLDSAGVNHGLVTNGASYAAGQVGQAFVLDGVNDFIQIADAPALRPASVTLETWVLFTAAGTRILIGKPVGGGTIDSYQIYLSAGTLGAFVGDAVGAGTVLSSPFAPVFGQWYHVAYTFDDATRQQVLYLDGITVASGLGSKGIGYDAQPVLLGCDIENGSRAYFLAGRLDEAAIYNRALRADEIAALHDAGAGGKTTIGPYFSTTPPLPDAVLGQAYSQPITALRGAPPIVYSLAQGTLPAGIALNSSGLIGGVPAVAGLSTFTVRATDASGLFAEQFYTLQVFAPFAPPAGLLAWWRGNNNAQDAIGTNHGTLLGGATFGPGKVDSAFDLNGTSSFVAISNSAWLNPTGAFSVEAWIKASPQQFGPDHLFLVVDKSHGFADGTGWVMEGNADGTMGFYFGKGGNSSPANFVGVSTIGSVQDDRWHHVAGTFTGAALAIYEDGILQNVVNVTNLPAGNPRDVEIGRSWGGGSPSRYFHGRIDEVSYYGRALSDSEIGAIYNAGPAGKGVAVIAPALSLWRTTTNTLLILWSSPSTGFTLQQSSNLGAAAWISAPETVNDNGSARYIIANPAPGARFYRLFKP